jgi:hypothetical protein
MLRSSKYQGWMSLGPDDCAAQAERIHSKILETTVPGKGFQPTQMNQLQVLLISSQMQKWLFPVPVS